jgi:hypothetical protein
MRRDHSVLVREIKRNGDGNRKNIGRMSPKDYLKKEEKNSIKQIISRQKKQRTPLLKPPNQFQKKYF